jgi:hypothetical protein
MATQSQQEVFTEKEAQEFLRMSEFTLYQLRKRQRIAFHRLDRKILYRRQDLENFLDSIRQPEVTDKQYAT